MSSDVDAVSIGTAAASSGEFRGIKPRLYIEYLL